MLIGIIPANMGIGIIIATADHVIYSYYATVPHIWGFTAVEDQSLAGVIMWIPGSMMLILAILLLLSQALRGTAGAAALGACILPAFFGFLLPAGYLLTMLADVTALRPDVFFAAGFLPDDAEENKRFS